VGNGDRAASSPVGCEGQRFGSYRTIELNTGRAEAIAGRPKGGSEPDEVAGIVHRIAGREVEGTADADTVRSSSEVAQ